MDEIRFPRDAWNHRTPRLRRRVLRVLAIDALVFAALFAAGEFAVRVGVPDCRRFLYGESLTAGHPIVWNSAELREREFPRERPLDETRILCLGDSVTFGSGLAADQAWPRQLESELRTDFGGRRLFVINAADQGQSLREAIELLEHRWLAYEPSLVVLGFSSSMISQPDVLAPRAPASAAAPAAVPSALASALTALRRAGRRVFERVHSSSCLYTLAAAEYRRVLYRLQIRQQPLHQGGLLAYAFAGAPIERGQIEKLYAGYGELLGELKSLLDARGIPLIVVAVPARFELSADPADNEFVLDRAAIGIRPGARIAATCRALRIPYLDLLPALRTLRASMRSGARPWDDLYVDMDCAHLNEAGCRTAAREIGRMLLEDARLTVWRSGRTPFAAGAARFRKAERPRQTGL
jgi:SGNH hydrolase-like domain, acetyltransferase AlgX